MSELTVDAPALAIVDRSSLERCDVCPAQAKFVADKRVITASHETDVGNAVHEALGELTTEYVESRGQIGVTDLVDTARQLLCASRPDIQGDAIAAVRASLWAWAKHIHGIHPENVLRWDGGKGDRSGQLAWDIDDLKVRVTSEVDFLSTGRAPEVVNETDYKSGRKVWTAADVEDSFQFAMHAWLILENYPEVQLVNIRVWNTRLNSLTYGVHWKRDDLYQLQYRIRSSVQNWLRYRDVPAEDCPTWPTVEKCQFCPAAALCPAVPADIQRFAADPAGLVETMVATQAKLDALAEIAKGHVTATGKDIITASGAAFGIGKPKRQTKPRQSLYSISKEQDGDDDT